MREDRTVLIIDDDPVHLQIYGWILKGAGFIPYPALVGNTGLDIPKVQTINVVVLDYRLTGGLKAVDAAALVHRAYPEAPIILLSDLCGLPEDIAPYVKAFVRKGEPEKLIATVKKYALRPDKIDGE